MAKRRKRRSQSPDARKARELRAALEAAGVQVHKVHLRDGRLAVHAPARQHGLVQRVVVHVLKARIVGHVSRPRLIAGPLVPVPPGAGLTWNERLTGVYGTRPVA